MAMLNNQRVYIYIYIYISWYNQYVQRNLPLLAGFFSQLCTEIVPLSHYPLRELEENQRNCMDLHDGVLFRTWFSPYVPHVSCLLLEKIAAGNVQLASRWSSPCWKEQRSLRAMSGSLGVGKLEPHPMVGSRKQHENISCILGIRDIVEIWWICWHIEMMLLYVVVFLHFAVYMLELVTYFQVCSILLLTKWLRRIFLLKSKGIDFQGWNALFWCISTTWTMNTQRSQNPADAQVTQVLSSRFCRVASTRFKLYTPVIPSISSTGWWFGTFFYFSIQLGK